MGIPVPDSARTEASSALDTLINQAVMPRSPEPSDEEQYREEAQLAHEIEEDIQDTEEILDAAPPGQELPSEEPGQPGAKPKGRTRNNELHFWFSDAELMRFRRRVERSGLNQSEFLRRAALTGKIVIEERDPVNIAILDELTLLRAELGRQGGLLKMIIKPNEGQRQLAPEEWDELIQMVRYMEKMKKRLGALEEKI